MKRGPSADFWILAAAFGGITGKTLGRCLATLRAGERPQERANFMDENLSSLTLDPDGDDFILRRTDTDGITTTIALSAQDVLTLAQSAPALQQQVLSRHAPKGGNVTAIAANPVKQIEIIQEMLGENILLAITSLGDGRTIFAVPLPVAQHLTEQISAHLAAMQSSRPHRQ
jgi:hypothetical protein